MDYFTDEDGSPVPPSHYGIPGGEITPTRVEFTFAGQEKQTSMRIAGDNPFDAAMTVEMTKSWNSMYDKLVDHLK